MPKFKLSRQASAHKKEFMRFLENEARLNEEKNTLAIQLRTHEGANQTLAKRLSETHSQLDRATTFLRKLNKVDLIRMILLPEDGE